MAALASSSSFSMVRMTSSCLAISFLATRRASFKDSTRSSLKPLPLVSLVLLPSFVVSLGEIRFRPDTPMRFETPPTSSNFDFASAAFSTTAFAAFSICSPSWSSNLSKSSTSFVAPAYNFPPTSLNQFDVAAVKSTPSSPPPPLISLSSFPAAMPSFSIDINKSSCFARIAEKEEEAFEFWSF